jgi:hypothetical protein
VFSRTSACRWNLDMLRTHARTHPRVLDVSKMLIRAPFMRHADSSRGRADRTLILIATAALLAACGGCSTSSARDEYQMTRNIRIAPSGPSVASQPGEPDELLSPLGP